MGPDATSGGNQLQTREGRGHSPASRKVQELRHLQEQRKGCSRGRRSALEEACREEVLETRGEEETSLQGKHFAVTTVVFNV